jgi:benzaldehyde dehydrogenase (NAD)
MESEDGRIATAKPAPEGLLSSGEWREGIFAGAWMEGQGGIGEVLNPATGETLAEIGRADPSQVSDLARAAATAQPDWARAGGIARAKVLAETSRLLERHAEEIAGWLIREAGSAEGKARFEVGEAAGEFAEAAALASQPSGRVLSSPEPGRRSFARRVPLGVVGVITPWNVPLLLASRSVAPALATGNTVLLKPDPQTPVSGGVLLAHALAGAGLPPGVFTMVVGGAEVGEAIVEDPGVDAISFTGSSAVGRRIGALAGPRLKKLALELGGNSPFIVLADANPDRASSAGAWGSFHHQGQICMAASRHLVHESIADPYLERLVARARSLRVGDPSDGPEVDLGPLINERQAERVESLVRSSVDAGAVIEAGGERTGLFFQPTVLSGVTPAMPVFSEEIFGPVAPVTTFRTDEEAIELANATDYGLSAAVQSASPERAQAIADRLRSGSVHVNDQTVNDSPQAPFGGRGASGNASRFGGEANWEAFTQWQWVTARDEAPEFPF